MANVLVVDDEPLVCEMLSVLLTRQGHTVHVADNGQAALRQIGEKAIDLVIIDIVMPQMDGLEAIKGMQERRPDLDIIAISGGARIGNYDILAMAEKYGARQVFNKPLDNDALLEAVARIVGKQRNRL